MPSAEQRLMKKINDIKIYSEVNMIKHDQILENAIRDKTSKIEKNIQFLAGQLIDTRNKVLKLILK